PRFRDHDARFRELGTLLKSLGDQLREHNDHREATRAYRLTLRVQPGLPRAHQGLAIAHSHQGATDQAAEHARQALASLRASSAPPSLEDLESKAVLARILCEQHLERSLGKEGLARARHLSSGKDPRGRLKDYYTAAILEIADTESSAAFTAFRRLFADTLVDAAQDIAITSLNSLQHPPGPRRNLTDYTQKRAIALELLAYARTLYPEHLDAWILAANISGLGTELGTDSHDQVESFTREAMALLNRLEYGDDEVFTKDPRLMSTDRKSVRAELETTLRHATRKN
ncbi:MAG: hypothetical protein P8Y05_13090, partial [Deinococcales bacterium]